jgi:hypothetical protein
MLSRALTGEYVVSGDGQERLPIFKQRLEVRITFEIRVEDVQGQIMATRSGRDRIMSYKIEGHATGCGTCRCAAVGQERKSSFREKQTQGCEP